VQHLDDRAEFLGEQRRDRIVAELVELDVDAGVAGEGHFAQGREQAAVGAVVIGEE
jgi:hypothetical protein